LEFTIRPSTVEDAAGLWRCLDAVARERRYIAMVEAPALEQVRAFLSETHARGIIQLVALADFQIIGSCDVTRKPMEGFRHSATLGMGLLFEYRGRGLGGALLRSVLRQAEAQHLGRIEPEVYTSNERAIALYERFGLTSEGVKRSACLLDGRSEDVLCMRSDYPRFGRALPDRTPQMTQARWTARSQGRRLGAQVSTMQAKSDDRRSHARGSRHRRHRTCGRHCARGPSVVLRRRSYPRRSRSRACTLAWTLHSAASSQANAALGRQAEAMARDGASIGGCG
jgi:RimJ/RimL family protein N-acetyltransferase